jgi:hypothetical protein
MKKRRKLRHKGRKKEETVIGRRRKGKKIKDKNFPRNQNKALILFRITVPWNRLGQLPKGDYICYRETISFGYCAWSGKPSIYKRRQVLS